MTTTAIEWATHTMNFAGGCSKASAACRLCYAINMSNRLSHMPHAPGFYKGVSTGKAWTGAFTWDVELMRERFAELHRAKKPRRVFVGSMTDLFHPNHHELHRSIMWHEIRALWSAIQAGKAPKHLLLFLTKRPDVMRTSWETWAKLMGVEQVPPCVMLGTTVENQRTANERIRQLLWIPSRRFLSMEPLLGPVNLRQLPSWMRTEDHPEGERRPLLRLDALTGQHRCGPVGFDMDYDDPQTDDGGPTRRIHWVIAGGESGRSANPTKPNWLRSLRDQCRDVGVPFFFKQWGEWAPSDAVEQAGNDWPGMSEECKEDGGGLERHFWPDSPVRESARKLGKHDVADANYAIAGDSEVLWVGKKVAGRHLDGRLWSEVPHDYRA